MVSHSQEISRILRNPDVQYRIYKNPPSVPALSQINSINAFHHTSWRSTLILSSHLNLSRRSRLVHSRLPTKILWAPLFSLIPARCLLYLILLDLITRMIFCEEFRWQISSLCSLLHSLSRCDSCAQHCKSMLTHCMEQSPSSEADRSSDT
jgi:hypothetical protein